MLNIYDLHKRRNARERNRLSYYKRVLHKCYHRIVTVSENCKTECVYKIPEFVVGMPIYNSLECVKFVVRALKKNGFYIRYTHPNLLFISWKKIPESHYPHSKRNAAPKKTKPPVEKEKNIGEYRDITDKEHELPYNTKILNNLEGRLRDILR